MASFNGTMMQAHMPPPVTPWSTGICDCLDDRQNCVYTCFCPCFTYGMVAEIVDRGATSGSASAVLYGFVASVTGCLMHWMYSCFNRNKMRAQYGLHGNPLLDGLAHCAMEPCALCQEYRELKNRGFVVEIGWQANMERRHQQYQQQQGVTVPPAMDNGMIR
ncbi:cell number regulator 2 [Brachypodium distachyon]|uniref:Uncharacterized protein n=1 Tax=Brachypodium distachyon TaxID=15368 RepID=I1GVH1_BRADI|nr:cell number regulator 2 [Brachypodium distachyon]KQK16790.1 hypothetical protein BRADI_1g30630v3 [Brachypodium distachyon]|eukprot:XP_003560347.2 cell number regulator 2 [Brachypodium distachyon]